MNTIYSIHKVIFCRGNMSRCFYAIAVYSVLRFDASGKICVGVPGGQKLKEFFVFFDLFYRPPVTFQFRQVLEGKSQRVTVPFEPGGGTEGGISGEFEIGSQNLKRLLCHG